MRVATSRLIFSEDNNLSVTQRLGEYFDSDHFYSPLFQCQNIAVYIFYPSTDFFWKNHFRFEKQYHFSYLEFLLKNIKYKFEEYHVLKIWYALQPTIWQFIWIWEESSRSAHFRFVAISSFTFRLLSIGIAFSLSHLATSFFSISSFHFRSQFICSHLNRRGRHQRGFIWYSVTTESHIDGSAILFNLTPPSVPSPLHTSSTSTHSMRDYATFGFAIARSQQCGFEMHLSSFDTWFYWKSEQNIISFFFRKMSIDVFYLININKIYLFL